MANNNVFHFLKPIYDIAKYIEIQSKTEQNKKL